ncbi:MAG: C25 family cysteine peptidase [Anaerolineae bacterium]
MSGPRLTWSRGILMALLLLQSACTATPELTASPEADLGFPQSVVVPSSWVVFVHREGPYWLGPDWWRDRGIEADNLDEVPIRLTHKGEPIPYQRVAAPEGWGLFFYAQADAASATFGDSYVVTVDEASGAAFEADAALGAPGECQTSTLTIQWHEEDAIYRPTSPADPPWLWQPLRPPESLTFSVVLTDVVPSQPVSLTVRLWGQSSMPEDPDHHLRVTWEDGLTADHYWDGAEMVIVDLVIPDVGQEANTLQLAAPGGTEAAVEVNWLDGFGITWRQELVMRPGAWVRWQAESDAIACIRWQGGNPPETLLAVMVDDSSNARLGDVTWDAESGQLQVPQRAGDLGWVGIPWEAPSPDRVRPLEALVASEFREVEYLAVAAREYHAALKPLLDRRAGEGYAVGVTTPEALYDTYGNGLAEAGAIQEGIRTLDSEGALNYVLLVGDAPTDSAARTDPGLAIPTAWVETAHLAATASDFLLVSDGSSVAVASIGRLPVETPAELERVVEKTLTWQPSDRLALVGDDEAPFAGLVNQLNEIREASLVLDLAEGNARDELLAWLAEGAGTLVYAGHGSMQMLGDEAFLTAEDGESWDGPTVVVAWTCLCAGFAHPGYEALAEAWLGSSGGVVAVVGPTGETTTAEQKTMALALQQALVSGETLGDAMCEAWAAATSDDARRGFLLLGDPAIRPMSTGDGGMSDQ